MVLLRFASFSAKTNKCEIYTRVMVLCGSVKATLCLQVKVSFVNNTVDS